ncbi:DMT family transporter [Terrilactibacillus laevilacticus]|uniref:DMT family transporter n=1 Tax=Terrilactibacillus laevilacticus TaxID=1380157 RepID=UPI0011469592|nr:EamA family transporter [Terrilactibacillus laevilacticus]
MKSEKIWLADLSLLLVAIVWGSSYLATKIVLTELDVYPFLFIRFFLTIILMVLFTYKQLIKASKQTWITGMVFGLFLAGIFTSETWGIQYTSASNAGFLISLFVVFTPLVESLMFKEKIRFGILVAVILSVIGTFFLTMKSGYTFNIGDLLILLAALLRAIQMTVTQKMTKGHVMDSGALTTIQLGVVAIVMGILSLSNGDGYSFFSLSLKFWFLTAYLAIFCTLLAFYIQLTLIRRTSPTRVGLLMGTEPVFSALFAVCLGGDLMTLQEWIGGLLIVAATYYGRYMESRSHVKGIDKKTSEIEM